MEYYCPNGRIRNIEKMNSCLLSNNLNDAGEVEVLSFLRPRSQR